MKCFLAALCFVPIAFVSGYCQVLGDTIYMRTSSPLAPQGFAEVGVLEQIAVSNFATSYQFSVTGENNPLLTPFLPDDGITVSISVSDTKPYKVVSASAKFDNCKWLTGIYSSFQFIGAMEFYFPVLKGSQKYEKGDSYTVRLSDTIGVSCIMDDKGVFHGSFTRYANALDQKGTPIALSDPLLLTAADDNPFRFRGVTAHSAINSFTSMDLSCCGEGYYALEMTAYRSISTTVLPGIPAHAIRHATLTKRGCYYDISGRKMGVNTSASLRMHIDTHGTRYLERGSAQ